MSVSKKTASNSTEISTLEFTNDELLNITDFQSAVDLIMQKGGDVALAHEVIGNGFALLDDKKKLVDVPFIVLQWKFNAGTFGEFATMLVITQKNEKFIVSDGSGIPDQLKEVTERLNRTAGLAVAHGLVASDYLFCEDLRTSKCQEDGAGHKHIPATSYYLNLSA